MRWSDFPKGYSGDRTLLDSPPARAPPRKEVYELDFTGNYGDEDEACDLLGLMALDSCVR